MPSVGLLVEDLIQVMLGVTNVVERNVRQGDNRVVSNLAWCVAEGFRNAGDDVRQVMVVGAPELDQMSPAALGIALRCNPLLLSVAWKAEFGDGLGANESLVVIGCRVDEVSEDLLA